MHLYFIKPPSQEQSYRYGQNIKSALRLMKDIAERGIDPRIMGVAVTNGCDHNCRFCFFDSVPLRKARYIGMEAISVASEKLGLLQPVSLTGGEPLDHPNIVRLARWTGGRIPTTNGFSLIESEEECVRTLKPILDKIMGVSFHAHGRENPGRLLVMKQMLLHGITPEAGFIAELGEEEKLLHAWLATLMKILRDPDIRVALADPKVGDAFVRLFGVGKDSTLRLSLLERSGKGADLNGLNVSSLSINELLFENGVQEALHYTLLLPDGSLVPNLFYYYLARKPGPHVFANITDPADAIRSKLQASVIGFIDRALSRDDAQMRNEVVAHYENCDSRIASFTFFISLLKERETRIMLSMIKHEVSSLTGRPFVSLADVSNAELDAYIRKHVNSFKEDSLWYIQLPHSRVEE